jgi:hypothetical protein
VRGVATASGRFFGYKRDTPTHRKAQTDVRRHLVGFYNQTVPDAFSLRTYAAPTFDQGMTGHCGGAGSAQGLATASMSLSRFNNTAPLIPFIPSPRCIYATTRRIELADPSVPLTDSGIYPTDLIATASYFGVRPMFVTLTPDGRFDDVWGDDDLRGLRNAPPANVNDDPNFADLMTAGLKRTLGEYRIDETQAGFDVLVRQTIAIAKVPVGVGTFVDSAVMQFTSSSAPVGAPNMNDPNGGGHWIVIDGYRRDPNNPGDWIYDVHNSWGSAYGDAGGFRGNTDWLAAVTDLIPWTIR